MLRIDTCLEVSNDSSPGLDSKAKKNRGGHQSFSNDGYQNLIDENGEMLKK
jgi:hypothetical protein